MEIGSNIPILSTMADKIGRNTDFIYFNCSILSLAHITADFIYKIFTCLHSGSI